VEDKLSKGFILPVLINKVLSIPQVEAYLIYIIAQNTIDKYGQDKTKYQPCYNLLYSSKYLENLSINKCHLEEEMHTIQYAFAL